MEKLKMHSPEFTEENITKLAELFPNCITETRDDEGDLKRAIDLDQLRQELSAEIVEGPRERYHLNWPGKREALLAANAPIAKTLRPCPDESVDFDTTKNIFIEGDNLDALKLLQETYLGKIKMIYIDPPYNTGNDLIYKDNFTADKAEYDLESGQRDEEEGRLVANTESNGRFHSDWLTMLYPRLRLARNLLQDDGIIFISIDDGEAANLRKLCNEILGEENFVAQLVWKSRVSEDTRATTGVSTDHEYIMCFSNSKGAHLRGSEKDTEKFSNPDNDSRGPWRSADLTGLANREARPNLHYDLIDPETELNYGCPPKGWRYEPATMQQKIKENRILFPTSEEGRPRHKLFLNEMKSMFKNMTSIITQISTADGTREINQILGNGVFPFPKPSALVRLLIEQATSNEDILLDFFSGSATSAHALMAHNAENGGNRRHIMVQLPEKCDEDSEAFKAGYKTIAEIGKERIRRAGKKIKEENPTTTADLDIGFRVLKVDSSNMKEVYRTPDAVKQDAIEGLVDNLKEDRKPEDLLFQVLLDWGVDLSLPITEEALAGKTVFFVDSNALAACFDPDISEELVKELAQRKPLRAVFRDASYDSDSVKINVEQIFKTLSPESEIKSI